MAKTAKLMTSLFDAFPLYASKTWFSPACIRQTHDDLSNYFLWVRNWSHIITYLVRVVLVLLRLKLLVRPLKG